MSPTPASLAWKRVTRRFITPLRTASGEYAQRESLVLRVETQDGRAGFAEAAPWPGFATASLDATEQSLRLARRDPAQAARHALVQAALDWTRLGRGAARVALPCAALLRDDADAPALLAAGYRTLKRKIGVGALRDEQRTVANLVRAAGPGIRWRVDANGALSGRDCAAWCDFLSEFEEIEWLEQPMGAGAETAMRELAERAGVADRLALDESVDAPGATPQDWPGLVVVKPALAGDTAGWRAAPPAYPRRAYGSVFETAFGRQAALCLAAEDATAAGRAVGFGTLGAFADALDRHAPGPVATTVATDWDALWAAL